MEPVPLFKIRVRKQEDRSHPLVSIVKNTYFLPNFLQNGFFSELQRFKSDDSTIGRKILEFPNLYDLLYELGVTDADGEPLSVGIDRLYCLLTVEECGTVLNWLFGDDNLGINIPSKVWEALGFGQSQEDFRPLKSDSKPFTHYIKDFSEVLPLPQWCLPVSLSSKIQNSFDRFK
ncbi:hypothetical protein HK100_005602, partial [Physocladia obscura]